MFVQSSPSHPNYSYQIAANSGPQSPLLSAMSSMRIKDGDASIYGGQINNFGGGNSNQLVMSASHHNLNPLTQSLDHLFNPASNTSSAISPFSQQNDHGRQNNYASMILPQTIDRGQLAANSHSLVQSMIERRRKQFAEAINNHEIRDGDMSESAVKREILQQMTIQPSKLKMINSQSQQLFKKLDQNPSLAGQQKSLENAYNHMPQNQGNTQLFNNQYNQGFSNSSTNHDFRNNSAAYSQNIHHKPSELPLMSRFIKNTYPNSSLQKYGDGIISTHKNTTMTTTTTLTVEDRLKFLFRKDPKPPLANQSTQFADTPLQFRQSPIKQQIPLLIPQMQSPPNQIRMLERHHNRIQSQNNLPQIGHAVSLQSQMQPTMVVPDIKLDVNNLRKIHHSSLKTNILQQLNHHASFNGNQNILEPLRQQHSDTRNLTIETKFYSSLQQEDMKMRKKLEILKTLMADKDLRKAYLTDLSINLNAKQQLNQILNSPTSNISSMFQSTLNEEIKMLLARSPTNEEDLTQQIIGIHNRLDNRTEQINSPNMLSPPQQLNINSRSSGGGGYVGGLSTPSNQEEYFEELLNLLDTNSRNNQRASISKTVEINRTEVTGLIMFNGEYQRPYIRQNHPRESRAGSEETSFKNRSSLSVQIEGIPKLHGKGERSRKKKKKKDPQRVLSHDAPLPGGLNHLELDIPSFRALAPKSNAHADQKDQNLEQKQHFSFTIDETVPIKPAPPRPNQSIIHQHTVFNQLSKQKTRHNYAKVYSRNTADQLESRLPEGESTESPVPLSTVESMPEEGNESNVIEVEQIAQVIQEQHAQLEVQKIQAQSLLRQKTQAFIRMQTQNISQPKKLAPAVATPDITSAPIQSDDAHLPDIPQANGLTKQQTAMIQNLGSTIQGMQEQILQNPGQPPSNEVIQMLKEMKEIMNGVHKINEQQQSLISVQNQLIAGAQVQQRRGSKVARMSQIDIFTQGNNGTGQRKSILLLGDGSALELKTQTEVRPAYRRSKVLRISELPKAKKSKFKPPKPKKDKSPRHEEPFTSNQRYDQDVSYRTQAKSGRPSASFGPGQDQEDSQSSGRSKTKSNNHRGFIGSTTSDTISMGSYNMANSGARARDQKSLIQQRISSLSALSSSQQVGMHLLKDYLPRKTSELSQSQVIPSLKPGHPNYQEKKQSSKQAFGNSVLGKFGASKKKSTVPVFSSGNNSHPSFSIDPSHSKGNPLAQSLQVQSNGKSLNEGTGPLHLSHKIRKSIRGLISLNGGASHLKKFQEFEKPNHLTHVDEDMAEDEEVVRKYSQMFGLE
ncbi:hypothetical protein FGO68_gene8066 [Halteria grandinella]|uniref:Uncharacterized protein n=1 Tax=Halteria grandinella TaxID=5974 RepID=A0A8J8P309_HALGN|nr:hypothetical protein FGO68_gene8066 [Halteria grandinella]